MSDKKSKLDNHIWAAHWSALAVILGSIILLFILISKMFLTNLVENNSPSEVQIKYELSGKENKLESMNDSLNLEYQKIIHQNNLKVVDEVNKSIKTQYDRIQTIIDSKEEQNIYSTYGAGIIALILGVAGFFGFKSINEMKKDAIETAEIEAKEVAGIAAKKELQDKYLGIKNEVIKEIEATFIDRFKQKELVVSDEFVRAVNEQFDEKIKILNDRLEECCEKNTSKARQDGGSDVLEELKSPSKSNDGLFTDLDLNQ